MGNENRVGFKAYNPGLVCRGYKYEEGKTYKKYGHGICCHGLRIIALILLMFWTITRL